MLEVKQLSNIYEMKSDVYNIIITCASEVE